MLSYLCMSKEKIIDNQFLLIINGPSCGGKSAVADVLYEKYGGIFHGKSDHIKWLISDYDPNVHREFVHLMTYEIVKVALLCGFSIIKEGNIFEPEKYVEIAKKAEIPLFVANIEAPRDVLLSRFEKRIEAKKLGAKKIANTDPRRFKELYDMYNSTKMETSLVFDSSKQNPEEIAETIVTFIRKQ